MLSAKQLEVELNSTTDEIPLHITLNQQKSWLFTIVASVDANVKSNQVNAAANPGQVGPKIALKWHFWKRARVAEDAEAPLRFEEDRAAERRVTGHAGERVGQALCCQRPGKGEDQSAAESPTHLSRTPRR